MERFLSLFIPQHYDLDFAINADKTAIEATVSITGEALVQTIKLHAENLELKSLMLDERKLANDEYAYDGEVLTLAECTPGEHKITVEYRVKVREDMLGAYLSTYRHAGKLEKIVTTQFESHYARSCFPCVDEPAAKATFKLTLASNGDDVILSNMPADLTQMQDGVKTVYFKTTPRMSTYLLAFSVGNFQAIRSKSAHGIEIACYAGQYQKAESLQFAVDFAAKVLDFYDDLFQTPFPLPKLDLVALPDFDAGAMENWGLVTFREIALIADPDGGVDQKTYVATVVAHELAHMWFGDLVTMAWWDDLWLNESFANMMEIYSTDKVCPELNAWDDFYTGTVLRALRRDALPGVQPVRVEVEHVEDIDNLFDGAIVYAKGGRLMVMLMRAMGEQQFFAGIAAYFKQFQYANACADDLWGVLNQFADFDVCAFMQSWLTQPGYPVLIDGEQERFLITDEHDSLQYNIAQPTDDLSGHYLICFSDQALAEKLARRDQLSKEQKLRIIFDTRLLAKTSRLTSTQLFALIEAFADERDVAILEGVFGAVADLRELLVPDSEDDRRLKRYLASYFAEPCRALGLVNDSADSIDTIRRRELLMSIMYYTDDTAFLESVEQQYGEQPIETIDEDLRAVILLSLLKNDSTRFDTYSTLYRKTPDASLRQDLAVTLCSCLEPGCAASYLAHLQDGVVRPQDRLSFIIRLARNHVSRAATLDWFYANWDWLYENESATTISDYPRHIICGIKDRGAADIYKQFFTPKLSDPALTRNINIAISEIDANLANFERDQPKICAYLAQK